MTRKKLRWLLCILAVAIPLSMMAGVLIVKHILRQRSPNGSLFVPGRADGWIPYGGTWKVTNDEIRNDSLERGAKFVKGSSYWTDYSLESDLESLNMNGDIGLVVRSTNEGRGVDSFSGYYIGLRRHDSSLIIGRTDYGWAEYATVKLRTALQPFHWYHLKVVAVGCTIAARFTNPVTKDSSAVSMNEASTHCARSGRVGLRSVYSGGVWKNIRAFPATAADLQPLLEDANPTAQASRPLALQDILDEFKPAEDTTPSILASRSTNPTEPIDNLRLSSVLGDDTVSVRGKVILTDPVLLVQDSTGGAFIPSGEIPKLSIGDEILVEGKAEPHPFSSTIRDAKVTLLWPGSADPPFSITPSQAATGAFDARFVELQAHLDSATEQPPNRLVLDLYEGDQRFQALLQPYSAEPAQSIPVKDSFVQVRGVCVTDSQYTKNLVPFVILLRSANDLKVINGPPWWSTRNLITGAALAVFLSLLGILFYTRAEQWRLRAVIEERLRLAHELHDTLAQSFAGIGFQLRAILENIPDTLSPLRDQVEITSELVRQGHQEARRSISTLRIDANGHHIELLPTLAQAAQRMISDGSIVVETSASGDQRRIPLKLTDVLFRIGQEAIANAVRHANASRIQVHLDYQRTFLQFTIEDNGVGFNPDEVTSGGFGLNGIRARANTVGGTVRISSTPGNGTRLQVDVPLPPLPLLPRLFPWLQKNARHRQS
jgi:signal transduction histidine kinase